MPVARIVERQAHLQEQAKINEDKQWQELENYYLGKKHKQRLEHQTQVGIRIYYYHNDHLGTPQELTNALGEVVWLNYSQAWGGSYETKCFAKELDNLDVSADLLQPIRFQGQFFDGETNLHYNRFRYYDSDVGMFVQRDPIGLMGGINSYQYAPNPIIWIDPTGLNKKLDPARQKCPTGKWIKPPEVIDKDKFGRNKVYETYNEARARAKQLSELNNVPTMPYVADMGPRIGEVVGSQSLNRYNHWRVDYDPASDKGFHINWRRIEKQANGDCKIIRGVILVRGGEDAYLRQMERMPKL